MAFEFRKSFSILPGVRINLNKKSASVTFGRRGGPHLTRNTRGRTTESMDLPGPFSWRRTRR